MALNAISNEKEAITEHGKFALTFDMHILHTVLYTFLILLTKRTCLTIESRLRWCI